MAVAVAVELLLAACDDDGPATSESDAAPDAVSLTQGEALYGQHCASCHGLDGEGEPDWRTRDADGLLPARLSAAGRG